MLASHRVNILRAFAAAIVALGSSSCRPHLTLEQVAGCWAFERRDGNTRLLALDMPDTLDLSTELELNPDGRPYPRFPNRVKILSHNPEAGRHSIRVDSTHILALPTDWSKHYVLTVWRLARRDSIAIMLHANMSSSWMIRLRAVGTSADSLLGYAEHYSDVVSDHPWRIPLVARRTVCPGHPAARAPNGH